MSSSFSLSSAGGVVSLLNDTNKPASGAPKGEGLAPRSAINVLPSPQGSSSSSDVSSSRMSTTNESSSNPSPPSSVQPSVGTAHESSTESLSDIVFSDAAQKHKDVAQGGGGGHGRTKAHTSRPQHLTPNQAEGRGRQGDHILGDRLASSPKPIEEGNGKTKSEEANVPMNMHKASSFDNPDNDMDVDAEQLAGRDSLRSSSLGPSNNHSASISSTGSSSSSAGASGPGAKAKAKGKKRYPCAYEGCEKTFSTSGHAARHHRIHTGQKPFHCTFPGCKAVFSRQDNSLQHYRTHVCHPKSRARSSSMSSSMPPGSEQVQQLHQQQRQDEKRIMAYRDMQRGETDADADASVQMGRKALENGTAIAVVQEVIDEEGRPREVVQRMVGVPKGNRRGSSSTTHQPLQQQHVAAHQETVKRESEPRSTDEEEASSRERSHFASYQPQHSYTQQQQQQQQQQQYPAPPQHPSSYGPGFVSSSHEIPAVPAMTYPATVYSSSGGSGSSSVAYRHHPYAHLPLSAAPSVTSSSSSSRGGRDDGNSSYDRHRSRATSSQPYSSLWQDNNRFAIPHEGQPPSSSPFARGPIAHQGPTSDSLGARRLSETHDRKRFISSYADTRGDPNLSRPSLARFADEATRSTWPPPSTMSLLGEHRNSQMARFSDDAWRAQSLAGSSLPTKFTAEHQSRLPPSSSPPAVPSAMASSNLGFRSRGASSSMRLDGPLPSISQLPCSSDRSTSTMTPTTPLEGFSLHPPNGKSSVHGKPSVHATTATDAAAVKLPPLRNA